MSKSEVEVGQEWVGRVVRVRVIRTAFPSVVVSDIRRDGTLGRTRSLLISSLRKNYQFVGSGA